MPQNRMHTIKNEEKRIEKVANWYSQIDGVERLNILYIAETVSSFVKGRRILEMGPAEGLATEIFANSFPEIEIVEGSKRYCDKLTKELPSSVKVHHALFEKFKPLKKYDTIIMSNVLEHVHNPVAILKQYKSLIKNNGRIIITVPNANSIHRHIGVELGFLQKVTSLNDRDIHLGHRRVYTLDLLKKHISQAGFKIIKESGIFLKVLSNKQLEKWPEDLLQAMFSIGEKFPNIASQLLLVVQPKKTNKK